MLYDHMYGLDFDETYQFLEKISKDNIVKYIGAIDNNYQDVTKADDTYVTNLL